MTNDIFSSPIKHRAAQDLLWFIHGEEENQLMTVARVHLLKNSNTLSRSPLSVPPTPLPLLRCVCLVSQVTTGASNDFQQVANIAFQMVTQWGMSEEIGPFVVNMGMDGMEGEQWGPTMNVRVNIEVERLVNQAYFRAKTILSENKELMEILAQKLLDQDTVTSEELSLMIAENAIETAPYRSYDGAAEQTNLPFQKPVSDYF